MRYLGLVTTCNSAGKLTDCEVFCVTEVIFVEITEGHSVDRTAACKKLITQGSLIGGVSEFSVLGVPLFKINVMETFDT